MSDVVHHMMFPGESHWREVVDLAARGQLHDLSELSLAVEALDGVTICHTTAGGYIDLSGETADIESPVSSASAIGYVAVPAAKGDVFYILGTGGNAGRLYGILDEAGNVLSAATANVSRTTPLRLEMTRDATATFVANIQEGTGFLLKGELPIRTLNAHTETLESHTASIDKLETELPQRLNCTFQQMAISGAGAEVAMTTRLTSTEKLPLVAGDIYTADEGYLFRAVLYDGDTYKTNTGSFLSTLTISESRASTYTGLRLNIMRQDNGVIQPEEGYHVTCSNPDNMVYNVATPEEVDAVESYADGLAESLSLASTRLAVLRSGVEINTIARTITVPAQRMLCGGQEVDIAEDVTLTFSGTEYYPRLVYDLSSGAFSLGYTKSATLTDSQYVVVAFNRRGPLEAAAAGHITVDGVDARFEAIRMQGNFQGNGAEDCNYSWWVYPEAVYYQGMTEKIYFGYTDSHGYIGVAAVDLEDGHIEKKILMQSDAKLTRREADGSYTLLSAADNHNDCAVNVMADGRILCVCAMHNTVARSHIFVSEKPESISAFTRQDLSLQSGYGSVSYAQCIYCGSRYNLFVRSELSDGSHSWWHYASSTDGSTWSDFIPFLDGENTDGSVSPKYYMRVSKDTDTRLKFFLQSNASSEASELRMGTFNLSSGNIMTNFGARVVGRIASLTAPIHYDSFDIVVPKPDSGYQRLVAVGQGPDYSVVLCPITNPTATQAGGHSYTTVYYRWNGSGYDGPYTLPSQGSEWGPNYQNGVDIVETDTLISCEHLLSGWRLVKYTFSGGSFTQAAILDETPSESVKLWVPIRAENSDYVVYNKGYNPDTGSFYNIYGKVCWRKYS